MSKDPTDETPGTVPEGEAPPDGSFMGLLAAGAWKLASQGPRVALDLAHKGLAEAEKLALNTLRRRMDAAAQGERAAPQDEDDAAPRAAPRADGAPPVALRPAAAWLARLLDDAAEQSADDARERLHLRIVRQLVPDEARILAALADGHAVALVHLGAGPMVGPATQRRMENLSPVGRDAGVRLIAETPRYVTHLRALGLLESGDEDKSMLLKYQLIEADTPVRQACAEIEKSGLRPKFFRRTLRISEAGRALWSACAPDPAQDGR